MDKRVCVRLGNIFAFDSANGRKRYFQYICNDRSCMNTQVIRVFKTTYSHEDNSSVKKIVNDEIDFYAHTIVSAGIKDNVWYKIGTSNDCGLDKLDKITFALYFTEDELTGIPLLQANGAQWKIWKSNERILWSNDINALSPKYLEIGSILPVHQIVNRLTNGYYSFTAKEYDVLVRKPYDGVDTFTRRSFGVYNGYFHFDGENLKNVVMLEADYSVVANIRDILRLLQLPGNLKFGDINWRFDEFISEEEYNTVLNQTLS